jgi:hypothetical protein
MALTHGVLALVGLASLSGIHLGNDGRYRKDVCGHSHARFCFSERILPESWKPGTPIPQAAGGASGIGPTDILTAYQVPPSTSAGGKIVVIPDSPDSQAFSDVTAYRANYGLPTLPKCAGASGLPDGTTPCFAQVDETGDPSTGQDTPGDGDGETALDMDMISAACPDCAILLVEIQLESDSDFTTGVATAAKLGAVATSISIGGPEQGGEPTGYTTPGHLVLAASGDWGYDLVDEGAQATPAYPSSAPDVVAVGGTTLFLNGETYDEAVWNDGTFSTQPSGQDVTTSGCSTEFAMPTYQATALAGSGCSHRATVDLAAAAAYYVGDSPAYIATYQGGWQQVEGTSASSPMMAAILTRVGLTDAISNDLSWEYTHASAFHDLGSASYPVDSNGASTDAQGPSTCGILCTVKTGWDGPSGVGTPDATKLAALAGTLDGGPSAVDGGSGSDDDGASDAAAGGDAGNGQGGDDDGGTPVTLDGGSQFGQQGGVLPSNDAGGNADQSGGPFGSSTGTGSGCACSLPGTTTTPLGDGSGGLFAVAAAAIVAVKRRARRCRS